MTYLYAAYTATWVIHIAYVGLLVSRYSKLRRDIRELNERK